MSNFKVCECVTERMHKLGLGVTDRTSTNAEGSSVRYLFWWLPRKRTWTRCRSKRDLDESGVLTTERLFSNIPDGRLTFC